MPSELSFSGGQCDGHLHAWGDIRSPHHHPGVCSPGGGAYDLVGSGQRQTASGVVDQWLHEWVPYGGGRDCGRHGGGDVDFERDPTCPGCVELHQSHVDRHPQTQDPYWRYDVYPDVDE